MIRIPRRRPALATALVAATTLLLGGCGKKEAPPPPEPPAAAPAPAPLAVASVDLGKAIGGDNTVTAALASFGQRDTIYASVSTTGVGSNAAIGAKWTFVKADGSEVAVNETSQTISPTGPVATEFHISKASPWPKGKYRVAITLNGAPAGTKDFEVQ
jgi:hypothetical protein